MLLFPSLSRARSRGRGSLRGIAVLRDQRRAPQQAPDPRDLPNAQSSPFGGRDFAHPRLDRERGGRIVALRDHRPAAPLSIGVGAMSPPFPSQSTLRSGSPPERKIGANG